MVTICFVSQLMLIIGSKIMAFLKLLEDVNQKSDYFDTVIGHIEDIVIADEFQQMLQNFLESHCDEFEDTDENKISYTDTFHQYTQMIENYIIAQLNQRMEMFDMQIFSEILQQRKPGLDGEIFELLFSMTDFIRFKEMMLDYKKFKTGNFDDIAQGIIVTKLDDSMFDDDEIEVEPTQQ